MAWERRAELYIGVFADGNDAEKGYRVDGLHFDFDIVRSTKFFADRATFNVYNPNGATEAEIMSGGCSVVFRAGYADQAVGNIFIGQIALAYAETERNGDRVLHVICNAQRGAQYPLKRTFVSLSFPVGTPYYDILNGVADFVGVPLSGASSLKDILLEDDDGPYVDSGSVRDVVENFVTRMLRPIGGQVLLTNNEMVYFNADAQATTEFETAYLTFRSGLISAREERDETYQASEAAFKENMDYYMGVAGTAKRDDDAKVAEKRVVAFESLINPAIAVGKPVYIDARTSGDDAVSVVGKFWVTSLHYSGSNYSSDFKVSGRAEE